MAPAKHSLDSAESGPSNRPRLNESSALTKTRLPLQSLPTTNNRVHMKQPGGSKLEEMETRPLSEKAKGKQPVLPVESAKIVQIVDLTGDSEDEEIVGNQSERHYGPLPASKETKQANAIKKNAERRVKRAQKDSTHQIQLRKKKEEELPLRIQNIRKHIRQDSLHRMSVGMRVRACNSIVDAVAFVRAVESQTQLNDNTAFLSKVEQPILQILWSDVMKNPLQFDSAKLVQLGVLVPQTSQEESGTKAQYYIRQYSYENAAVLIDTLKKYIHHKPWDMSYAISVLFLLGCSPQQVNKTATSALAGIGYSDEAEPPLFTSDDLVGFIPVPIDPLKPIHLPYGGYTIAALPCDRLKNDAKDKWRRTPNFISLTKPLESTFLINSLTLHNMNTLSVRTNPLVGHIEWAVITALGGLGLNSFPGGWRCEFTPSDEHRRVVKQALALSAVSPSSLGVVCTNNPELAKSIAVLCNDSKNKINDILPLESKRIENEAFNSSVFNAGGVLIKTTRNLVLSATVMKDITLEDLTARAGSIHSASAGRGSQVDRMIHSHLYPDVPPLGDLSAEVVARHFGPYVDFWPYSLVRKQCDIHRLFISRYLCTLRPIIIAAWSLPVGELFVREELVDVWSLLSQEECELFMGGHSGPFLDTLLPSDGDVDSLHEKTIPSDPHILRYGQIRLLRYGPGQLDIALVIFFGDPGQIKYEHIHARLRAQVFFLASATHKILKNVVSNMLIAGPPPSNEANYKTWLIQCLKATIVVLKDSGLGDAIHKLKQELLAQENTVRILMNVHKPAAISNSASSTLPAPHLHHPSVHVAYGVEERNKQIQNLQEKAHNRESLGNTIHGPSIAPFGVSVSSQEFANWYWTLADGVSLVHAANGAGTSAKGCEVAMANRTANSSRMGQVYKTINPDTGESLSTSINNAAALQGINAAILKLADFSYHHSKTKHTITLTFRFAFCPPHLCGKLIFGNNGSANHRCKAAPTDSKPLTLTFANYLSMERLSYVHNILNSLTLAPYIGEHPLQSVDCLSVLARHSAAIPHYSDLLKRVPLGIKIWSHADSEDNHWLLTQAYDAAIPFICKAPSYMTGAVAEALDGVWQDTVFDKIKNVVFNGEARPLFNVCCACGGFTNVTAVNTLYPKTKTGSWRPMVKHKCGLKDGKMDQTGEHCQSRIINSFDDFPSHVMQRLWYYQRVERHGDSSISDVRLWTATS